MLYIFNMSSCQSIIDINNRQYKYLYDSLITKYVSIMCCLTIIISELSDSNCNTKVVNNIAEFRNILTIAHNNMWKQFQLKYLSLLLLERGKAILAKQTFISFCVWHLLLQNVKQRPLKHINLVLFCSAVAINTASYIAPSNITL